ncbi:hypothetical protein [Helicobacter typhlonius]|uniref:hypothetical protein n=1 Tax=Helicobacter typhlonius TaxID=76936 RepID=UPI002FE2AB85
MSMLQISIGGGGNLLAKAPLWWHIGFFLFVCLYAFLIMYHSAFSVIDDHILTQTLLVGQNIGFFIQPNIGRFFPLDGQELNLLSAAFGVKAAVFYTFNALCVFVVIFALRYAMRIFIAHILESTSHSHKAYAMQKVPYVVDILLVLLLLSPSFIGSWLRLFVPERMEFVFLSLFLMSYAFVLESKNTRTSSLMLLVGLICANVSLYYKETTFAMIIAFAFVHLFCVYFSHTKCKIHIKLFDMGLILSTIVWFVVYVFVVLLQKQDSGFYGDTPYSALLTFAKSLFTYLCNEPFLCGIIFSALIYRIYAVLIKKQPFIPLLDASIWGSAILLCEYAVLKLSSHHYLLPAYVFTLIVIGASFLLWWQHKWYKVILALCAFMFVGNTLFVSAYIWAHYKFVPPNFQATLSFVSDYTHNHPHNRIFLEGVDRVSYVEVYHSFGKWLTYYGAQDFDLYSSDAVDSRFVDRFNGNAHWSVFQNNEAIAKQSGDLVIATPYSAYNFDLESLNEKYELLFSAEQGYNVPLLGLKTFLKATLQFLGLTQGDVILSQNVYALPLHFYVLRVR